MKTWNWLRMGMVGTGVLAAGITSTLGACSSDDEQNDPDSGTSSSSSSSSSGVPGASSSSGGGGGSSSGGGSSGALPPTATLAVGHGYAELGPIKICFAQSEGEAPLPGAIPTPSLPLPGATPIPPGAIGPLPKLGVDLQNVHILPYLIKASSLVGKETLQCTALIGPQGVLQSGVDYFAGPNIQKGDLKDDHAYVLFAHRPVGEAADAGTGELALYVEELDTTTVVPADKVGIQFIHGSRYLPPVSPFVYRPAAGEPITPDAGDEDGGEDGGDAGPIVDPRIQFLAPEGTPRVAQVAPPTPLVIVDAINAGTDTGFGVRFDTQVGPRDILHLKPDTTLNPIAAWVPLSDPNNVQSEGDAGPDGGPTTVYFQSGRAFTVMLFGDPSKAINPLDRLSYFAAPHFVVLPNRAKAPALGSN